MTRVRRARRPNPRRALDSILRCQTQAEAERRMIQILAQAWAAGNMAGWQEGVSDANDDEPIQTPNPYRTSDP